MPVNLSILYSKIHYTFQNESFVLSALTHRSKGSDNNERLEFLGDSILSFVIARSLYVTYPSSPEGELSRLRSFLVKGETLAEIARELELGQHLRLGQGEMRSGGFRRESILADCFEALIAAVYLDSDITTCQSVVENIFTARLTDKAISIQSKDPKTQLQELLQAKKLSLPVYTLVSVEGEQHQQRFIIECSVEKLGMKSTGVGDSRRKAEKEAAIELLNELCVK